jgi:aminopeptidase-like protein
MLRLPDSTGFDLPTLGIRMHDLLCRLFPLPRSITGDGLRATVSAISDLVQLAVSEIPSGDKVFDWTVPLEWAVDEAYVEDETGRRIIDWRESNLHVVGYSEAVDDWFSLEELRLHLHSLPDRPDWIPYRTSYYKRDWGFCVTDNVLAGLSEGRYHAVIRSRLFPGSLTLAETLIPGESSEEILIFAHDCHPSLANDNLSGLVVAAHLAAYLRTQPTRYSYRFVFAPATVGSIAWLARNESVLERVHAGLVLSLLGAPGPFHYKSSRAGGREIDVAANHVLATTFPGSRALPFIPWGYDERQFCSPGIDLPMGRLTRLPNGEFAEYHTSADDTTFVTAEALSEAWMACLRIFEAIERNRHYLNTSPKGEPQLGRRGLYRSLGGYQDVPDRQLAMLWVLNQSDGSSSILDISRKSNLPFKVIADAADDLEAVGLLTLAEPVRGQEKP